MIRKCFEQTYELFSALKFSHRIASVHLFRNNKSSGNLENSVVKF